MMSRFAIDRVTLRRNDDPTGEIRELRLFQGDPMGHTIVEYIGFLNDAGDEGFFFRSKNRIAFGRRAAMQKVFAEKTQELCDEGFTVCEVELPVKE